MEVKLDSKVLNISRFPTNKPKKSYDKAVDRLISIILKINQKERPSIKELAEEFNVTDRTIQNDIYKRLVFLPIEKREGRLYFPDNFRWNYI